MAEETEAVGEDDDGLRPEELVPAEGGTWAGLLFDNPGIDVPPQLTWEFTFRFRNVARAYGPSPVSLTVDWVALPGCRWWDMAGQVAAASVFAEPIEASVYFFEHHCFDEVRLQVMEQRGSDLRVRARLAGDVDGLGIDPLDAEGWLSFDGIILTESPGEIEAATATLAGFTDPTGLVASRGSADNYVFRATP